jgi:hypothetical protein
MRTRSAYRRLETMGDQIEAQLVGSAPAECAYCGKFKHEARRSRSLCQTCYPAVRGTPPRPRVLPELHGCRGGPLVGAVEQVALVLYAHACVAAVVLWALLRLAFNVIDCICLCAGGVAERWKTSMNTL